MQKKMLTLFGAILLILSIYLWTRSHPPVQFPTDPLLIEARGSDRAWQFSYYGEDGVLDTDDDIVSVGELQVPEGVEVVIQLRSNDYIYVFSCPSLELKEIAIPDLKYSMTFTADQPGNHELAMDPLCGFRLPPGETMGVLTIATATDFRAWINRQ